MAGTVPRFNRHVDTHPKLIIWVGLSFFSKLPTQISNSSTIRTNYVQNDPGPLLRRRRNELLHCLLIIPDTLSHTVIDEFKFNFLMIFHRLSVSIAFNHDHIRISLYKRFVVVFKILQN